MPGRCDCGCRIFFDREMLITTAFGAVFVIPSAGVVECYRCKAMYRMHGKDGEKKTLEPFGRDLMGERDLFLAALEDTKNTDQADNPDRTPDFITVDPEDKLDFERLKLREDELPGRNVASRR